VVFQATNTAPIREKTGSGQQDKDKAHENYELYFWTHLGIRRITRWPILFIEALFKNFRNGERVRQIVSKQRYNGNENVGYKIDKNNGLECKL